MDAERLERAGRLAGDVAATLAGDAADAPVVILAGPGLTGAVGIAAARSLHAGGHAVRLVLARHDHALHGPTAAQLALAEAEGITPWRFDAPTEEANAQEPIAWTTAPLLVDALLGSGIVGDPRDAIADLIQLINASRRPILAIDVPSGLYGEEGWILSPCVDATTTLTFDAARPTHREGWAVVGRLLVADLASGTVADEENGKGKGKR